MYMAVNASHILYSMPFSLHRNFVILEVQISQHFNIVVFAFS